MELAVMLAVFLAGIILIVKGGDFFVDAASWIAEISGIPKLVVGATIVSLATTLPELLVSMLAAVQGKVDMAVGNAVGSVTANLGLIMAISVVCMPGVIRRGDYLLKSLLMLSAAGVLVWGCRRGGVGLALSLPLLAIFAVFTYENIRGANRAMHCGGDLGPLRTRPRKRAVFFQCLKFSLGAAAVVLGVGRAIGEAMAVMMVSGNAANMPSLFESVRFLTTAVSSEMSYSSGLQRQALFSIALVLFLFIMLINAVLNFFLKGQKEG